MQIRFFMAYAVNIDRKKGVYSDSSIPEAATFFPMSAIAIVKPSLENRADNKADMPDYQNVEMIAAILWVAHAYAIHKLEIKFLPKKNIFLVPTRH